MLTVGSLDPSINYMNLPLEVVVLPSSQLTGSSGAQCDWHNALPISPGQNSRQRGDIIKISASVPTTRLGGSQNITRQFHKYFNGFLQKQPKKSNINRFQSQSTKLISIWFYGLFFQVLQSSEK